MRLESSVTSVSWIPSASIAQSAHKVPFEMQIAQYDAPPPDHLDDAAAFVGANHARLGNQLSAWIDLQDGVVTDSGQTGRGYISGIAFRVAGLHLQATPVMLPERRSIKRIGNTAIRFEQTAGGRTGLPGRPSWSRAAQYWRVHTPLVWTTLALTLHGDGSAHGELVGASPFPRHWLYDGGGNLLSKSATMDFKAWTATPADSRTPWGGENSEAVIRELESALERELSVQIMSQRTAVRTRRLPPGAVLTEQGESGEDLYLLLDGVLWVEVDGELVAEVGPGAILGERSGLEDRRRTATLRAATSCTIAVTASTAVSRDSLSHIADTHRREIRKGTHPDGIPIDPAPP